MPSTSDEKHARAIMARHDGVKYTEALRFVAELKGMRERNESRAALGLNPVVTIDPMGPAWKHAEAHRFLAADGTSGVRIARSVAETHEPVCCAPPKERDTDQGHTGDESLLLDESHRITGGGKTFLAWLAEVQRAARVASGRDRDAERLLERTRSLRSQSMEDFNLFLGRPRKSQWMGDLLAEGPLSVWDPKTGQVEQMGTSVLSPTSETSAAQQPPIRDGGD